jgi:hypothetical protein
MLLLVAAGAFARTAGLISRSIWVDDVYTLSSVTGHSLDVRLPDMAPEDSWGDPDGPVPASSFLTYIQPRPDNSVAKVVRSSHAGETHPPLFFLILYGWLKLTGFNFASARVLSILLSLAAIPLVFAAGRRLVSEPAAWVACALWAVAPFHAQLSLQVRMYTLVGLVALATTWLAWEITENGASGQRLAAYFALCTIGVYSHYYFVLYIAFQLLWMFARRRWKPALLLSAGFAAVGAPLALYLAAQTDVRAQTWMYSRRDTSELLVNAGAGLTDFLAFSPGDSLAFWTPAALLPLAKVAVVALIGYLLLAAVWPAGGKVGRAGAASQAGSAGWRAGLHTTPGTSSLAFLLLWLLGPAVVLLLLDTVRHTGTFVHSRYLIGSAPALYLLLAVGLVRQRLPVGTALAVALALVIAASHGALRRMPIGALAEGADFQRAAGCIASAWRPGDLVVVHTSYPQTPVALACYLPPQTPVLSLVYNELPERGMMTARAKLCDLQPRMDRWASTVPRLWVLRAFANGGYGQLDSWLAAHYTMVHAQRFGSLVLREMRRREPSAGPPGFTTEAQRSHSEPHR